MSIKITAIRLSGSTTHQHISRLWWSNPANGKADDNSRTEIVAWIEQDGGKAYVEDRFDHRVDVQVVRQRHGEKYLRSYADGVWTDNLLALPKRDQRGVGTNRRPRLRPHAPRTSSPA